MTTDDLDWPEDDGDSLEETGGANAYEAGYEHGYSQAHYQDGYNQHCRAHGFSGSQFVNPTGVMTQRYQENLDDFMRGFQYGVDAYRNRQKAA